MCFAFFGSISVFTRLCATAHQKCVKYEGFARLRIDNLVKTHLEPKKTKNIMRKPKTQKKTCFRDSCESQELEEVPRRLPNGASRILLGSLQKGFVRGAHSETIVNSLQDCEVEGSCCCRGQVFLLIPSVLGQL